MRKIYYLKTCDTCKKIIKSLPNTTGFVFQEIKEQPVTASQLQEMRDLAGSYEVLFSKRAKLYKEMGLKDEKLTEDDFKRYILEHYTFLNRPIVLIDKHIFVGNSPKNTTKLIDFLTHE